MEVLVEEQYSPQWLHMDMYVHMQVWKLLYLYFAVKVVGMTMCCENHYVIDVVQTTQLPVKQEHFRTHSYRPAHVATSLLIIMQKLAIGGWYLYIWLQINITERSVHKNICIIIIAVILFSPTHSGTKIGTGLHGLIIIICYMHGGNVFLDYGHGSQLEY